MFRLLKTITFLIFLIFISFFCFPFQVHAQQLTPGSAPNHEFMKAKVIQDKGTKVNPYSDYAQSLQMLSVQIMDGADAGTTVDVAYDTQHVDDLKLKLGDTVILSKTFTSPSDAQYTLVDKYRDPGSAFLIILFVALVIIIAGWKGVGAIVGLCISFGIIFFYIVPQIIAGQSPLLVIFIGAIGILLLTTYIAHGFSKQTTIALVSTFLALLLTIGISFLASQIAAITGFGDDNAKSIHFATKQLIDVRGLLLGGIILGTVGALNDVTTTQVATMFALKKASSNFTFKSLVKQGFAVGKEHVVSIINTLVLAYAGSSLAVFIFIFLNASYYPSWVIFNSELLNEELIRTVSGTIGLILVVPIVTLLTGYILTRDKENNTA